ncbi:Arm DNA-binding domain-containing protein, partial [Proteiniphilum sp. UBA5384]|uniref:Arm DNA-binding domain-containing protein n=1 Tax=Proteiniphilum sp. UBA5384 TaxID=1947279 RepID=UPI0025D52B84
MNVVKSTFNLLFVIRRHRLLKNGEAPIYLRVTVNGEVADITTKRSIHVKMWDQRRESSSGKTVKDRELNHYLETLKMRM